MPPTGVPHEFGRLDTGVPTLRTPDGNRPRVPLGPHLLVLLDRAALPEGHPAGPARPLLFADTCLSGVRVPPDPGTADHVSHPVADAVDLRRRQRGGGRLRRV